MIILTSNSENLIRLAFIKESKFGDSVKNKYLKQGIPENKIEVYIKAFEEIRKRKPKQLFQDNFPNNPDFQIPKNQRNNVDVYHDFKDLEFIVDYIRGQVTPISLDKDNTGMEDANVIYEDNGLKIMRADSSGEAINAKGNYNYSWCVAAEGNGNLFNSYRYNNDEPTFYFILDKEEDTSNPYHFFVIQSLGTDRFKVTSKDNDGDKQMSWKDIVSLQPKLKGKESILKWIPVPEETKERLNRYQEIYDADDDNSFVMLPYEQKKEYISYLGTDSLSVSQFRALPKELKNLQIGLYADTRYYDDIKDNKQLLDRYIETYSRQIKSGLQSYVHCPDELKNNPKIKKAKYIAKVIDDASTYNVLPEEFKKDEDIINVLIEQAIELVNWDGAREYIKLPDIAKKHPLVINELKKYHNEDDYILNLVNEIPTETVKKDENLLNLISEALYETLCDKTQSELYDPSYINHILSVLPNEISQNKNMQDAYAEYWSDKLSDPTDVHLIHEMPSSMRNNPKIVSSLKTNLLEMTSNDSIVSGDFQFMLDKVPILKNDKNVAKVLSELWLKETFDDVGQSYIPADYQKLMKTMGENEFFLQALNEQIRDTIIPKIKSDVETYVLFNERLSPQFLDIPEIKQAVSMSLQHLVYTNVFDYYNIPKKLKDEKVRTNALLEFVQLLEKGEIDINDIPDEFKNHPSILNVENSKAKELGNRTSWASCFNDNYIGNIF